MQHSSGSGSGDGDYPSPLRQPKEMYVGSCGLWKWLVFSTWMASYIVPPAQADACISHSWPIKVNPTLKRALAAYYQGYIQHGQVCQTPTTM
jgi:hypothetical protein